MAPDYYAADISALDGQNVTSRRPKRIKKDTLIPIYPKLYLNKKMTGDIQTLL